MKDDIMNKLIGCFYCPLNLYFGENALHMPQNKRQCSADVHGQDTGHTARLSLFCIYSALY